MNEIPKEIIYKCDAVQRTTDHVIGYDFDTQGYVCFTLTSPINPCMMELSQVQKLTLSAITSCIDKHVRKELAK